MKALCKKIANGLRMVFGYSIVLCLLCGVLSFFGYVAALCIGGDLAADICQFISKQAMPWVIRGTSVTVLLGLLIMYLSGETALTAKKKKEK